MPLSSAHDAPLGATVRQGGTAFRVWAPRAEAIHIALSPPGVAALTSFAADDTNLLARDGDYWSGFLPGVGDGWQYRFFTVGANGTQHGLKRDPRARELELFAWPDTDCIVRGSTIYRWHDGQFQPPRLPDLVIYQFHIGVFYARRDGRDIRLGRVSKFLDAADRIEYLSAMGFNAVQPLPFVERDGTNSRGYNSSDFFSPEMDYGLAPSNIGPYLDRINTMFRLKGLAEVSMADLSTQIGQLKAFVDLCHVNGIAVIADVVYNHAGPMDSQAMRFFDQPADQSGLAPDSFFIGGGGWAGGRIFDYSADEVRQFLIDNARYFYDEFHVDGFRYDEVTVGHWNGGDGFWRDLTSTLHFHKPGNRQIAEFWEEGNRAFPVQPGGLGFDASLDDRLRKAVRSALADAAGGRSAQVNLDPVRDALRSVWGFPPPPQSIVHLENHDLVDADRDNPSEIQPRIAQLAYWDHPREWYGRSRSRVATGILLTGPGTPMMFMGEEFLEAKPWHNDHGRSNFFIDWDSLDGSASDPNVRDFNRFVRELTWLRRRHPALRGDSGCNPYFNHNYDRVLAFHRWVDGIGRDAIIVASFNEEDLRDYPLPLPVGGHFHEVFNAAAYDTMPPDGGYNSAAPGNPGGIDGNGPPLFASPTSARVLIPANGFLVFARDRGD